jgi:dephospho-CoA kinase
MIYLIGLTGNIATGKSLVARKLSKLGAHVIDADALVHELQRKGTAVHAAIVAKFGAGILRPDGEINRAQLGALVFNDSEALRRLEAIVHPAVGQAIEEEISNVKCQTPEERITVVVEAIKLIEAGLHKRCNALWVVTARPEVQLERLMRTRGLSEADARLRIEAQPPQVDKAALANVLLENNGTLDELYAQVEQHWRRLAIGR